ADAPARCFFGCFFGVATILSSLATDLRFVGYPSTLGRNLRFACALRVHCFLPGGDLLGAGNEVVADWRHGHRCFSIRGLIRLGAPRPRGYRFALQLLRRPSAPAYMFSYVAERLALC